MNIFESLKELNVSEECFEDIVSMVEAMINEDIWDYADKKIKNPFKRKELKRKATENKQKEIDAGRDTMRITKLQKGAWKTDNHRGKDSNYGRAIGDSEGNALDPNIPLRGEKVKLNHRIKNLKDKVKDKIGDVRYGATVLKDKILHNRVTPPRSWMGY